MLLFVGTNLTDRNGQGVIENVTADVVSDRSLADVASVTNVYTSYANFLAGQVSTRGGDRRGRPTRPRAYSRASTRPRSLLWGFT